MFTAWSPIRSKYFAIISRVERVLPVVGVLGYLGDKLALYLQEVFIDDIVLVDDLLRKYCIMFYVSVNAFRDHVYRGLGHFGEGDIVLGVCARR